MMTVTVSGLEPNTVHWLNMHGSSTCARQVIYPWEMFTVGDLQADATGQGTLTTPLYPSPYEGAAGEHILTVHNVASTSEEPQLHIACADMPA